MNGEMVFVFKPGVEIPDFSFLKFVYILIITWNYKTGAISSLQKISVPSQIKNDYCKKLQDM